MAYKIGRTYRLEFDGKPGLWVRAKAPSIGDLLRLVEEIDVDKALAGNIDVAAAGQLLEWAGRYLVEWSVEDDDGPVPADAAGMMRLDTPDAMAIVKAWMDSLMNVDPTSRAVSPTGGPAGLEIPMTSRAS